MTFFFFNISKLCFVVCTESKNKRNPQTVLRIATEFRSAVVVLSQRKEEIQQLLRLVKRPECFSSLKSCEGISPPCIFDLVIFWGILCSWK